MQARVRKMWESVKDAGVDLLTEGIRLVQAAGEQLLQQMADRRIRVPTVVRDALKRVVGRAAAAPSEPIEFVCQPAGSDRFVCEPSVAPSAPADPAAQPAPKAVPRGASGRRATGRAESASAKRSRRRQPRASVPPSADDGIDAS